MKKVCIWLAVISAIVLLIMLGVVGVKMLDGNYDTNVEVIITGVSLVIFLFSVVRYKFIVNRCPHCGKAKISFGTYCPYCGKKID